MEQAGPNIAFIDRFTLHYDGNRRSIEELLRQHYELSHERPALLVTERLGSLTEQKAPFCIFIGPKDSDTILQALEQGIDAYITLPHEEEKLLEKIEQIKSKFYLQKAKEYNFYMLHQYKNAIDSSNIVSKTDIKGIITYVNEEFCKISGYDKEELLGKNHNIVRHPDVPKEHFRKFWQTILNKRIWKGTVKNRAKDGSTFYVNTTVIPITDYKGDITEFVAIRYDVTESVKLQEELKYKEHQLQQLNADLERRVQQQTKKLQELNKSLEKRVQEEVEKNRQKERLMFQQAKLASLGEMLGNIAHQWRQPLMELGILLYKMRKAGGDESIYERGMAIIERMNQTIIDFQNFFRPDKQKEWFSLEQTLRNVLKIVEGSLKKESIDLEIHMKNYMIYGYQNEFSQVLINLITNAKDALKIKPGNRKLSIAVEEAGFEILIKIIDNAGGIEENIIDKIFEPFFTTKNKEQGSGLGLYMSKMIIERSMEGVLEAENVGEGAKFTIRLKKWREDEL